jgi:UDP-glucose:(heptosyl)LPS alpha-1,3-glucosyltransferase
VTVVAPSITHTGGQERVTEEILKGLLTAGFRVRVIANSCSVVHPNLKVFQLRLPLRPAAIAHPSFLLFASLLLPLVRKGPVLCCGPVIYGRVEVMTVHFCDVYYRANYGGGRQQRDTAFYRLNDIVAGAMRRSIERLVFNKRRVAVLVAVSAGLAQELKSSFSASRIPDVVVIPNAVDLEEFHPDPVARERCRSELGLELGVPIAIFVGGDWKRKGLTVAIEALVFVDEWHLVIVGLGDVDRYLAAAVERGVGDRVHFVGLQTKVPQFYAAADVLVHPSEYETFSLVAYEASAAGLPVVSTAVNGVTDLVLDGDNGYLVAREPRAVAERLSVLLDAALRERMGRRQLEVAAKRHWSEVVGDYVELVSARGRKSE